MFIGRPAHTDETNMETSQTNDWDKHQHTDKQQDKPVFQDGQGTHNVKPSSYIHVHKRCFTV